MFIYSFFFLVISKRKMRNKFFQIYLNNTPIHTHNVLFEEYVMRTPIAYSHFGDFSNYPSFRRYENDC